VIVPSIDLQDGRAVQLRRGEELLLVDPRDPVDLARELNRYGPVAVVDLDAARGRGENRELIRRICSVAECRVGGGIRTEQDLRDWIRAGASKVMVGTLARPGFLSRFPREWIVACLDARGDDVVVSGWTERSGEKVLERARAIEAHCSEFLFTQVSVEGTLGGCDLESAARLRDAVGVPITVAGGIRDAEEIERLERLGCNSQIGRALYEGRIDLADAWIELVRFDDHGFVPVVVQEADDRDVLMLAYANADALRRALETGQGWYYSRSRQELWRKGATSGNTQELVRARYDCDRDAIVFHVRQHGPACHTRTRTCFGGAPAPSLIGLERTLSARRHADPESSYSARLMQDGRLLAEKLREETEEVIDADGHDHLVWECADLLYHLMVRMQGAGIALADVERELRSRVRPPGSS
jgi:phosphoribosyl-ATP pyrophosphohydrolase